MKKYFSYRMTIMMVTILSMTLVSCDKKDPTSSDSKGIMQEIQRYKWTGQSIEEEVYSYGTATYTQTWTVYFINDSQGVMHWTAVDRDTALGTSRDEDDIEFYYEIKGNTIHLYGGSNFVFEYYDGFLVEGETIFSPSSLGSSDYAYLQNYLNGNGGNNNGGGNNDNNSDITFHVGFANDWATLYDSKKGQYTHQIFMGYGMSKGNYKLGINEFGVCVRAVNGSVKNKNTHDDGLGNYVSTEFINGQSTKCFTGFLNEDIAYEWGTILYVTSKDKTVTLEYTPRYYNGNTGKYVVSGTETYVYTPKEIYTE